MFDTKTRFFFFAWLKREAGADLIRRLQLWPTKKSAPAPELLLKWRLRLRNTVLLNIDFWIEDTSYLSKRTGSGFNRLETDITEISSENNNVTYPTLSKIQQRIRKRKIETPKIT